MDNTQTRSRRSFSSISISLMKIAAIIIFFAGLFDTFFSPNLAEYRKSGNLDGYINCDFTGWEMLEGTFYFQVIILMILLCFLIIILEIIGRPRIFKAILSFSVGTCFLGFIVYRTKRYVAPAALKFMNNFKLADYGWSYKYESSIYSYREGFWIAVVCTSALVILSVLDIIFTLMPKKEEQIQYEPDKGYVAVSWTCLGLFIIGLPFKYLIPDFYYTESSRGKIDNIHNRTGEAYFRGFELFWNNPILLIIAVITLLTIILSALGIRKKFVKYLVSIISSLILIISTIIYSIAYIRPDMGDSYYLGNTRVQRICTTYYDTVETIMEFHFWSFSLGFWISCAGLILVIIVSVMKLIEYHKNKAAESMTQAAVQQVSQ